MMKIIAESAFNHNGSYEYLIELALAAKNCGADYFTVQVMDAKEFSVKGYSKYQLYIDTEISKENWRKVFDACKKMELEVIPCVLDEASFDFCYKQGFRFIKLHATDIVNEPFLRYIASKNDISLILETQVSTNFDIKFAVNILKDKIHCLMTGYSNYPTEVEDLNLNVIDTFKKEFPYKVGFADHSTDVENIPLMLLAKGCDYLEKHITLTRNNRNFDWQVSLYPEQFSQMVSGIKYYTQALGNGVKHPSANELKYRDIIFKKVLKNDKVLRRSDKGDDYITDKFKSFDKANVSIGLIARLKSKRLPLKVLKPFCSGPLIIDLYHRLQQSKKSGSLFLATSYLPEDRELADLAAKNKIKVFLGHPESVIDRLLWQAWENRAGAIFRVTGDNPFTDPYLMDKMIALYLKYDLDYVRVLNVPFGVSCELFSSKYLWNLYLQMDNPMHSEYLSWFVINDKNCRKGAIDFEGDPDLKYLNLSIDYPEDYKRAMNILKRIGKKKATEITLRDILANAEGEKIQDKESTIKLSGGVSVSFYKYLKILADAGYVIKEKLKYEDLPHR
ncbi:MAG: N-acetylneuraminate synthase family protein [Bacteroidia bacterium]